MVVYLNRGCVSDESVKTPRSRLTVKKPASKTLLLLTVANGGACFLCFTIHLPTQLLLDRTYNFGGQKRECKLQSIFLISKQEYKRLASSITRLVCISLMQALLPTEAHTSIYIIHKSVNSRTHMISKGGYYILKYYKRNCI